MWLGDGRSLAVARATLWVGVRPLTQSSVPAAPAAGAAGSPKVTTTSS